MTTMAVQVQVSHGSHEKFVSLRRLRPLEVYTRDPSERLSYEKIKEHSPNRSGRMCLADQLLVLRQCESGRTLSSGAVSRHELMPS